jgi:hypothetical protein
LIGLALPLYTNPSTVLEDVKYIEAMALLDETVMEPFAISGVLPSELAAWIVWKVMVTGAHLVSGASFLSRIDVSIEVMFCQYTDYSIADMRRLQDFFDKHAHPVDED